jgi:hypothetical protein
MDKLSFKQTVNLRSILNNEMYVKFKIGKY